MDGMSMRWRAHADTWAMWWVCTELTRVKCMRKMTCEMFLSTLFDAVRLVCLLVEIISLVRTLQVRENISKFLPKKKRRVLFLLLIWRSNKPRSFHHSAANNNSTQNDDKTSHRWDPTSLCAERVRKHPTQEPTQASLTADEFVVLVDFQNLFARFEIFRKFSVREKVQKQNYWQNQTWKVHETKKENPLFWCRGQHLSCHVEHLEFSFQCFSMYLSA